MDHVDPQGRIIRIDEALVKRELGAVVKDTVEETLNKMLDAEADELCKAGRYEHSEQRVDTRAGYYEVSKPRRARFGSRSPSSGRYPSKAR